MNNLKRSLAFASVICGVASGMVAQGGAAHAATPYCNNVTAVNDSSGGMIRYLFYKQGPGQYFTCDMNYYNENAYVYERNAIRQLQWDLKKCYGKSISADGEYGTGTREAVRQVQSMLGLNPDGWAGPNTRKKMLHVAHEWTFCVHVKNYQNGADPQIAFGYQDYETPYE
ncbi:peptidoglycan-binding domain-containing protein [Actinocorallia lasiicapitis]